MIKWGTSDTPFDQLCWKTLCEPAWPLMSPLCNPSDTRFAVRNGTRLIINPFAGVWNGDTSLALVTSFINELWKQLLFSQQQTALSFRLPKKKKKKWGWREYLEFFGCYCCFPSSPQGIHRTRSLHPNLVKKGCEVVKKWNGEQRRNKF